MPYFTDYRSVRLDMAAATLTDLYICPAGRLMRVTIILANRTAVDTTFRVSLAPLGIPDAINQYLVYDAVLPANKSLFLDEFAIQSTDKVRVWTAAIGVTVTLTIDDVREIAGS